MAGRSWAVISLLLAAAVGLGSLSERVRASDPPASVEVRSSLSYRGHENDTDSNNLVNVYPGAVGTRLDDCQTCHRGGTVTFSRRGKAELNPCSYCHLLPFPDSTVTSGGPTSYAETLNAYGLAYKGAGRDTQALTRIAGEDSDGDGYDNAAEIASQRYPGDAGSTPAQQIIPIRTLEWSDLDALTRHEQFMLMNAHRQGDEYVQWGGARVLDVLAAAGVPLTKEMTITCFAPDGYATDFTYDQIAQPFPRGLYYPGLDAAGFADSDQGFVKYPPAERIPAGLASAGDVIPGDPWLLVAWSRNGQELDASRLDAATGRLKGEGPYRLIAPQRVPGPPDRSQNLSPSRFQDGHDFDANVDHNSGLCVRGLVAIRVNPMPPGLEEFDWKNGGYALADQRRLILYGAGVKAE
jgi:hypothetical protein